MCIASANPAGRGVTIKSDLKEVFPHDATVMMKDSNQTYDEATFSYIHFSPHMLILLSYFSTLRQFQLIQLHEIN